MSKDIKEKKAKESKAKKETVDISPFISNPKGNVYAVTGLPEEFIATLFAWVSRSPKSFKEHLKDIIKEFNIEASREDPFKGLSKKAKDFHEKWTVGYGHSSVAEHALAHIGIEKVSRLASAELELSNQFLSITEYSQRYQKTRRGDWFNPFKKNTKNHEKYEAFMNDAFDVFETLIEGVHKHLDKSISKEASAKERKKISNQNLKLAFEDARYVLPLSMYTQLGMTANGRAWRDALAVLGNSDYKESVDLKEDVKKEITKVLPVLLKYADPSSYQINSKKRNKNLFSSLVDSNFSHQPSVKLLSSESEQDALFNILALLLVELKGLSFSSAKELLKHYNRDSYEKIFNELLYEMKHFDVPPEAFKHVNYQVEFIVSEANWHQLLRHNRKTNFIYSSPTPELGLVVPPRITEAGLDYLVRDIAKKSKELYQSIRSSNIENKSVADYVVLNAHERRVVADFDLWEAYHLINLRTSNEAQWDIKNTMNQLYKILESVHPLLISKAKRKLN